MYSNYTTMITIHHQLLIDVALSDTHLSTLGMTDRKRQTNAAHVRERPLPSETVIPTCSPIGPSAVLIDSVFLINTVHVLAPANKRMLPTTEKIEETKNVREFLAIPLGRTSIRTKSGKEYDVYRRDQSKSCRDGTQKN